MPSWPFCAVTESDHCPGVCHPQWFFYVPKWDGTYINAIHWFTRDTQPQWWDPRFYTKFNIHATSRYWTQAPSVEDVLTTTLLHLSNKHDTTSKCIIIIILITHQWGLLFSNVRDVFVICVLITYPAIDRKLWIESTERMVQQHCT